MQGEAEPLKEHQDETFGGQNFPGVFGGRKETVPLENPGPGRRSRK